MWTRFLLPVIAFSALAAPPGASVRTKVQVPAALRRGAFSVDRYLNVPPGFQVSLLALVSGARFLAVAPNGDVLVSTPGAGKVMLLRPNASFTFASGLQSPHDIVFHSIGSTAYVYISEKNKVDRFIYNDGDTAAHDPQIVVNGLPDSGHELKNIAIGPDDSLYVSIGSTCNVCTSDTTSDPVRASIYRYNADGTGGRLFARGLRNAEGVRFLPGSNTLWAAVNNRDDMPYPTQDSTGQYGKVNQQYVDNHPPDLFTAVRDGGNYGWPFCDSNPDRALDNMPFDRDYDTNRDGHVDCSAMDIPTKGIQAHSAPLGLAFLQDTKFPALYRNGAVVALHGSWNRSRKTGYKVAYFPFDPATGAPGEQIDLVTGWLDDASQDVWGRPVSAVVDANGNLLISDDQAGAIYMLSSSNTVVSAASGFPALAPESIGSLFGGNLASQTAAANSADWPTSLGGVQLNVQDSAGASRPAPLAYVSPSQINFEVPAGTAAGAATLMLPFRGGDGAVATIPITSVAPALFSANGDGKGVAAATAIRTVIPLNNQTPVPVFTCGQAPGTCKSVPIQLGIDTPIYLSLFGSGIRGRTALSNVRVTIGGVDAQVLYAGPQGGYPGLDQVNVGLPLSLRGAGEVDVILTVDGVSANPVRIAVE